MCTDGRREATAGVEPDLDPREWPAWTDDGVWHATDLVEPLTPREGEILAFVAASAARGVPPSHREIARHFDVCLLSVLGWLMTLRDKGWVGWDAGRARTTRLVRGRVKAAPRSPHGAWEVP